MLLFCVGWLKVRKDFNEEYKSMNYSMTFLAFLIIGGIVVAMLVSNFNNKLQALKKGLEYQIQTLTARLNKLESDRSHGDTDRPVDQNAVAPQIDLPSAVTALKAEPGAPAVTFAKIVAASDVEKSEIDQTEVKSNVYTTREYNAPEPSKFEKVTSEIVQSITNYFKTGNTVVKVGVVVLFFGISFLVKFGSDHGYLPIEIRLAAVALGGIALTQFGWRLRLKRPDYALVVQSGGVGILFITTFASLKLYHLIPAPLAFLCLVGLAGFTAWMAVIQNSKSLATFGIVGGFLAPVLVSTGQGNHVILFSYYALLNCGIVAIAWFKTWRVLNLLGFIFTYVISSAWGVLKYHSHNFWTVEPFLILFFLIYVAIPILFAKRQRPELRGYVDGTLIFGNAIIAFGLQTKLVQNFEYATAFSALLVSLVYIVLGRWLYMKKESNYELLVEAFVALGIVFATITIPLAFDGHWTAAVWAAEAAGIYWVSLRQGQILGRYFSSVLIFAAGVAFMASNQRSGLGLPMLNSFYFGCLMVAMGSLVTSFVGFKSREKLTENEKSLVPVFFVFGSLWWIIGGIIEIQHHLVSWWHSSGSQAFATTELYPVKYAKNISTAYVTGGLVLCSVLGRKLKWNYLTNISFAGVAFMAFMILKISFQNTHPFAHGGYIVWPLAFAFYYYILRKNEDLPNVHKNFVKYGHAAALWLLALVGSWELGWIVNQLVHGGAAWKTASHGLVPIGLSAVILLKSEKIKWPLHKYFNDYLIIGLGPVVAACWLWAFFSNWNSSGESHPLMYLPILNPLEATQAFFMATFPLWLFKIKKVKRIENKKIGIALAITYFFWLNGVLMRAIHHFAGVPFKFSSLFASPLVQMSLSIYWSIIGIFLMIFASKKSYRWLWISGVSLMGVVVLKLFLVDLSKSGTVERIVSFIGVGLILLLVGYFSPIPPKESVEGGSKT